MNLYQTLVIIFKKLAMYSVQGNSFSTESEIARYHQERAELDETLYLVKM